MINTTKIDAKLLSFGFIKNIFDLNEYEFTTSHKIKQEVEQD